MAANIPTRITTAGRARTTINRRRRIPTSLVPELEVSGRQDDEQHDDAAQDREPTNHGDHGEHGAGRRTTDSSAAGGAGAGCRCSGRPAESCRAASSPDARGPGEFDAGFASGRARGGLPYVDAQRGGDRTDELVERSRR